jgi:hypothetical protein
MASPPPEAEREAAFGRWIPRAALALVLLRGALVLSLGDVFFYGDELEKGAAGKALLDGLGSALGHHRLAYHYYEGGGFAVSALDALAFALVGQNLLALKLVALAFDLAILLAGASLARRAFGARAAAAFALLYVLAPESVQKNALLALGIHWQALLFCLVVLDRGGRIALEGDARRANWVAAGLAGGFGTYFNWGVAPAVAYAALAILVLRRRALATRGALLGVLAFALGLAPLAWMASRVGAEVLDIHGAELLGGERGRRLGAELAAFFRSVYAGRTPLDLLFVALVPLVPVVGIGAVLADGGPSVGGASPRRWALYLAGYLAVFTALYLASDFRVAAAAHYFQFHRLSQPWILGTLLAAGGLAALSARGGAARAAALCLGALLALGGLRGALSVIARGNTVDFARNWAILTRTKGYRYDEYVPKVWEHLEGDVAARVAALRAFDEPDPALLETTLAVHVFAPGRLSLAEVRAEAARLCFAEGQAIVALGAAWRERYGGELPDRRAAVLEREAVGGGVRGPVEESFGRFGLGFLVTEDRLRAELAAGLEHGFPPEYFRGLGYRLFSVRGDRELAGYWRQTRSPCFVDHDRALGFIGAAGEPAAPWLLEGFHRAVAEHSLD